MVLRTFVLIGVVAIGSAALAHTGVKNAAVLARMNLMDDIKEATGALGAMAKGTVAFDPAAAEIARAALQSQAEQIPTLFEANETDPKSESLPAVWEDWQGFVAASEAMGQAASALNVETLDGLRAGLGPLAQSCKSCHQDYRLP